ncbi:hypothetical protein SARC_11730, partial [Sphaeroforma arctica JP610]
NAWSNFQVVIRGDNNVGKSVLMQRLQGKPFVSTYTPTAQIEASTIGWRYDRTGDMVKVEVWDVVDHARVRANQNPGTLKLSNDIAPNSRANMKGKEATGKGTNTAGFSHSFCDAQFVDVYKNTHGVIFVLDVTKPWTFLYVQRNAAQVPAHIPILLLVNKVDLRQDRSITNEELVAWTDNMAYDSDRDVRFAEVSLKNGYGLQFLHSYLSLPFLHLQRRSLTDLLQANAVNLRETSALLDESKLQSHAEYIDARRRKSSGAKVEDGHISHLSAQTQVRPSSPMLAESYPQNLGEALPSAHARIHAKEQVDENGYIRDTKDSKSSVQEHQGVNIPDKHQGDGIEDRLASSAGVLEASSAYSKDTAVENDGTCIGEGIVNPIDISEQSENKGDVAFDLLSDLVPIVIESGGAAPSAQLSEFYGSADDLSTDQRGGATTDVLPDDSYTSDNIVSAGDGVARDVMDEHEITDPVDATAEGDNRLLSVAVDEDFSYDEMVFNGVFGVGQQSGTSDSSSSSESAPETKPKPKTAPKKKQMTEKKDIGKLLSEDRSKERADIVESRRIPTGYADLAPVSNMTAAKVPVRAREVRGSQGLRKHSRHSRRAKDGDSNDEIPIPRASKSTPISNDDLDSFYGDSASVSARCSPAQASQLAFEPIQNQEHEPESVRAMGLGVNGLENPPLSAHDDLDLSAVRNEYVDFDALVTANTNTSHSRGSTRHTRKSKKSNKTKEDKRDRPGGVAGREKHRERSHRSKEASDSASSKEERNSSELRKSEHRHCDGRTDEALGQQGRERRGRSDDSKPRKSKEGTGDASRRRRKKNRGSGVDDDRGSEPGKSRHRDR